MFQPFQICTALILHMLIIILTFYAIFRIIDERDEKIEIVISYV